MTKHFLMNYQNQKFIKGQIGELISNALSVKGFFLFYKQGGRYYIMKKIIPYFLFITFALAACSTARPVMQSKEATIAHVPARKNKESTKIEEGSLSFNLKESTTSTAKLDDESKPKDYLDLEESPEKTSDVKTSQQSTQSNQMISASEKDLGSADNEKSEGAETTNSSQTLITQSVESEISTQSESGKSDHNALDVIEEHVEYPLSKYNLFDYYPLIPNRQIDVKGGDFGDSSFVLQYFFEDHEKIKAQIKQTSSHGDQLNVIEVTPNQVSDLYYFLQIPYRANIMAQLEYEERIILKAPLQAGTTWESTGLKFEIIAVDQSRVINNQEMIVMDVEVSRGDERVLFTYAVGIGLVSNDLLNPDGTKTNIVQFSGMKEKATDDYKIELFFPSEEGNTKKVEATLNFLTNESLKDRLTQVYGIEAEANHFTPVLGENTKIQYILTEHNTVRVDLNAAFISSVNQTPDLENVRIQSLVDTLCSIYQVDGVMLSINDQRYESDHRKIEVDEVLTPSYFE